MSRSQGKPRVLVGVAEVEVLRDVEDVADSRDAIEVKDDGFGVGVVVVMYLSSTWFQR